jgi:uncharacterized SAM-binding protein YcdF (DUF218 family)
MPGGVISSTPEEAVTEPAERIEPVAGSVERERPGRRRLLAAVAAVLVALVLLVYAFSTPLLTAMGAALVHADPLERADAMIVLAPLIDRVVEAAELYRGGYAPIVVLTRETRDPAEQFLIDRGIVDSGEEGRRDILNALGVPLDAIVILDGVVNSTADEARGFADWAGHHAIRSVMVVTSPSHTARSRLAFLDALENLPIKVIVRPSRLDGFRSDTWWRSRGTLREGIVEWQKLVYYRLVELPSAAPGSS